MVRLHWEDGKDGHDATSFSSRVTRSTALRLASSSSTSTRRERASSPDDDMLRGMPANKHQ